MAVPTCFNTVEAEAEYWLSIDIHSGMTNGKEGWACITTIGINNAGDVNGVGADCQNLCAKDITRTCHLDCHRGSAVKDISYIKRCNACIDSV